MMHVNWKIGLAIIIASSAVRAEIIVDNLPLAPDEIAGRAPLLEINTGLSPSLLVRVPNVHPPQWVVPTAYVDEAKKALKQDEDQLKRAKEALRAQGILFQPTLESWSCPTCAVSSGNASSPAPISLEEQKAAIAKLWGDATDSLGWNLYTTQAPWLSKDRAPADQAKAKQLLAEAGYHGQNVVVLRPNASYDTAVSVADLSKMTLALNVDPMRKVLYRPPPGAFQNSALAEGYLVDSDLAERFQATISTIQRTNNATLLSGAFWQPIQTLVPIIGSADPRIQNVVMTSVSGVRFGKVLAVPAEEKKLIIEPSLTRSYDFYWLSFAISPEADDLDQRLQELVFLVTTQDKGMALELLPQVEGSKETVTTNSSAPSVGIDVKGVSLKLSDFYGQTVVFERLRPTIRATGLQTATFGWMLSGDAMAAGSSRFVAIVGVPKTTSELVLQLAVYGKSKSRPSVVYSQPLPQRIALSRP